MQKQNAKSMAWLEKYIRMHLERGTSKRELIILIRFKGYSKPTAYSYYSRIYKEYSENKKLHDKLQRIDSLIGDTDD